MDESVPVKRIGEKRGILPTSKCNAALEKDGLILYAAYVLLMRPSWPRRRQLSRRPDNYDTSGTCCRKEESENYAKMRGGVIKLTGW